jgi:hypothetical protein
MVWTMRLPMLASMIRLWSTVHVVWFPVVSSLSIGYAGSSPQQRTAPTPPRVLNHAAMHVAVQYHHHPNHKLAPKPAAQQLHIHWNIAATCLRHEASQIAWVCTCVHLCFLSCRQHFYSKRMMMMIYTSCDMEDRRATNSLHFVTPSYTSTQTGRCMPRKLNIFSYLCPKAGKAFHYRSSNAFAPSRD